MATRPSRAKSGTSRRARAAESDSPLITDATDSATPSAPASAWHSWATLAKSGLALQIDLAQAVLHGTETMRNIQLETNLQAQAAKSERANELAKLETLNDIADAQFDLLREDLQSALTHWSRLGEVAAASGQEAWERYVEGMSRLQSAFMESAIEWTRLSQTNGPEAAQELEASMDHMVNPLMASPLWWPTQEAAREAVNFANSALNDWFSWSKLMHEEAQAGAGSALH